jgi:hypothetical protein
MMGKLFIFGKKWGLVGAGLNFTCKLDFSNEDFGFTDNFF